MIPSDTRSTDVVADKVYNLSVDDLLPDDSYTSSMAATTKGRELVYLASVCERVADSSAAMPHAAGVASDLVVVDCSFQWCVA